MNITEFLEARIAEDEAVAGEALSLFGESWRVKDGEILLDHVSAPIALLVGPRSAPVAAAHILATQPARVLAECAAKRAIVAMFTGATEATETLDTMGAWEAHAIAQAAAVTAEGALKLLAAVYDQHPDYDQAWRNA